MDDTFLSSLAQRLRDTREDADLKQNETAIALGINLRTYRRYEYGESEPQAKFLADFCRHFGVSSDYLLGLNNTKPEPEVLSARFKRSRLDDLSDNEMAIVESVISALRKNEENKKRPGQLGHSSPVSAPARGSVNTAAAIEDDDDEIPIFF